MPGNQLPDRPQRGVGFIENIHEYLEECLGEGRDWYRGYTERFQALYQEISEHPEVIGTRERQLAFVNALAAVESWGTIGKFSEHLSDVTNDEIISIAFSGFNGVSECSAFIAFMNRREYLPSEQITIFRYIEDLQYKDQGSSQYYMIIGSWIHHFPALDRKAHAMEAMTEAQECAFVDKVRTAKEMTEIFPNREDQLLFQRLMIQSGDEYAARRGLENSRKFNKLSFADLADLATDSSLEAEEKRIACQALLTQISWFEDLTAEHARALKPYGLRSQGIPAFRIFERAEVLDILGN